MKIIHLIALLSILACTEPGSSTLDATKDAAKEVMPDVQCPPGTPSALAPPADVRANEALQGKGVQRYSCAGSAIAGYAWTFVAPDADLFTVNVQRFRVVHHTAGPTWTALDGSAITAVKIAGVSVDPSAIDWLLLQVTSVDGDGYISAYKYIQRLATQKGLAPPASGCNADTVGKAVEIPYQALYVFYVDLVTPGVRCGAP